MNPRLQPLVQWWSERNLRERLLVTVGGTVAFVLLADSLMAAPMEKRLRNERGLVQAQQAQIERLRNAFGSAASIQQQREQAQRLQQRVQAAQTATRQLRQQAADAARLPETLRAITGTVGSARLLALELSGDASGNPNAGANPPANPNAALMATAAALAGVAPPASAASAAAPLPPITTASGTRLYRLPITLKVSGTYEELQMLLTQIERHAEAMQWSSLSLDNSEWPAIQLTLKAHVLSPDPRWGAAS